jgi:hypothetical protein
LAISNEAVAKIPDHFSDKYEEGKHDDRLPTIVSRGSPVRYYLPGVPVVVGATLSALLAGWGSQRYRPWLTAIAANALTGLAVTVYLVPAVNLKLFVRGHHLTSADQQRLLKKWYRLNAIRLVAVGSACLICSMAPTAPSVVAYPQGRPASRMQAAPANVFASRHQFPSATGPRQREVVDGFFAAPTT